MTDQQPRLGDRLGACTACGYQVSRIPNMFGYAPCPKCGHALAFDAYHWQRMSNKPVPYLEKDTTQ